MADLNKIIRVLDLSQSDAREGTLDGIVKYILYGIGESGLPQSEIANLIEKELSIIIHNQDIEQSIARLEDTGLIEKSKEGVLKLNSDEIKKFRDEKLKIQEVREARFKLFKEHIEKIAVTKDYAIDETEISSLWEIFRTFIYDCYLTHGKYAVDSLTSGENEYDESVKRLVKKYVKEAKSEELGKILKKYIRIYPEIIDSNILEYLRGLAYKTEAFYSLGLSQKEYDKLYEKLKFNWTIFVDTNFIYSILDLTNNPEKEASKFLLELGTELGIKFMYIPKTYQELNAKQNDFDKYLNKDLLPSQIRALLKSGKLDSFAESYYGKLLEDRENTSHPSEIIFHAQNIMKERKLVIYNSKFESLNKKEEYLKDQESAFNTYSELLDGVRISKGLRPKGRKDPRKLEHDIFLREAILHLRSDDVSSINNAQFFGVTLDLTLIKFDLDQLKRKFKETTIIPTFFKPSLLLKKLLKQAPLKTKENYLRAFISTISTPAIDENKHLSKVAIRSLKYFHNMGIDNEKLILDCLKDELFLKTFESKESDVNELEVFMESEINKQISIKTEKIEELEEILTKKDKRINKVSEFSANTNAEKEKLLLKTEELKQSLDLYTQELKKLKNKESNAANRVNPVQLSIYDEKEKLDSERKFKDQVDKNDFLTEKVIEGKLQKRRQKGIILSIIALVLTISIFLIFSFIDKNWNYMTKLITSISGMDDVRENIAYIIIAFVLGLIETYLIIKIINIFWSKKSEKEFIADIKEELRDR